MASRSTSGSAGEPFYMSKRQVEIVSPYLESCKLSTYSNNALCT
jgi:hypothetical protein